MKIYLSGKITGLPEKTVNRKFQRAEDYLKKKWHEVISPIKLPHNHDHSWERYMMENLNVLIQCDAIGMLTDFEDSPGALIELAFAKRMGKQVFCFLI